MAIISGANYQCWLNHEIELATANSVLFNDMDAGMAIGAIAGRNDDLVGWLHHCCGYRLAGAVLVVLWQPYGLPCGMKKRGVRWFPLKQGFALVYLGYRYRLCFADAVKSGWINAKFNQSTRDDR